MMISVRRPPPMYIVFTLLSVAESERDPHVPPAPAIDTSEMRARGLEPLRALRPNGT
jgi:hypothetical protein